MKWRRRSTFVAVVVIVAASALVAVYFGPFSGIRSPATGGGQSSTSNSTSSVHSTSSIHSTSQSSGPSGLNMTLGSPSITYQNFTYGGSTSFPAMERLPVTVSSRTNGTVNLSVSGVPSGIWAKFVPSQILGVDSAGKNTTLVIAGGIRPLTALTTNLTLVASAQDEAGQTLDVSVQLVRVWNVSVISSAAPISFLNKWGVDANGSWFQVYGAVYDPGDQGNRSLAVNLKVLGLDQNGTTVPIPSWLTVGIPVSSFSLQSESPYYFVVTSSTASAPQGTYELKIQESVSGQVFFVDLRITVGQPIHL